MKYMNHVWALVEGCKAGWCQGVALTRARLWRHDSTSILALLPCWGHDPIVTAGAVTYVMLEVWEATRIHAVCLDGYAKEKRDTRLWMPCLRFQLIQVS